MADAQLAGLSLGLGPMAFSQLLGQARRGEAAAVLAAVDQDRHLLTRASAFGSTLLHESCSGGHMELAGALLERGADLHAKESVGRDACYWACKSGNAALVSLLLDKGASPHTRVPNYYSCISRAAAFDHLPIVLLLISKGADLVVCDDVLRAWGDEVRPRLGPEVVAERLAQALATFRAGPHPSQVQRRKDERWARRWPFVSVAVGHGLRPLAHQQALLSAAALPPSAHIPSLTALRLALLRDKVFTHEPLFKLIVSYI